MWLVPAVVATVAAVIAALVLVGDPRARGITPEIRYASFADVVRLARDEPVVAVEDPEVALVTASVPAFSAGTGHWGMDTGRIIVSSTEVLIALDLRDPDDGAVVRWCPSSQRFEHPETTASYAFDGTWRAGRAGRGLDRFGVRVDGSGVVIETGTWVSGPPRDRTAGDVRSAGPAC